MIVYGWGFIVLHIIYHNLCVRVRRASSCARVFDDDGCEFIEREDTFMSLSRT
jgi:hypothetical protein